MDSNRSYPKSCFVSQSAYCNAVSVLACYAQQYFGMRRVAKSPCACRVLFSSIGNEIFIQYAPCDGFGDTTTRLAGSWPRGIVAWQQEPGRGMQEQRLQQVHSLRINAQCDLDNAVSRPHPHSYVISRHAARALISPFAPRAIPAFLVQPLPYLPHVYKSFLLPASLSSKLSWPASCICVRLSSSPPLCPCSPAHCSTPICHTPDSQSHPLPSTSYPSTHFPLSPHTN